MDGYSTAAITEHSSLGSVHRRKTRRNVRKAMAGAPRLQPSPGNLLLSSLLIGVFAIGLSSTVLQIDRWNSRYDIGHLIPMLATVNTCLALIASWVAFMRWRHDGDLLSGRLAVAIPCLIWGSQAIVNTHGATLGSPSSSTAPPNMLRILIGVLGTGLVLAQLLAPRRSVTTSLALRTLLCVVGVGAAAVLSAIAFKDHAATHRAFRAAVSSTVFPVVWIILAFALLLVRGRPADRRLHVHVSVLLALLAVGQLTRLPGQLTPDQQTLLGSTCGSVALVGVLIGLGQQLRLWNLEQQRQLIAFEIERAVESRRRETESLTLSRKVHDQRASLLSVEAVIRVLEDDGHSRLDPSERRRLTTAATEELQRLRSLDDGDHFTRQCIDIDLRSLLEPLIAVSRADGANVTMTVRPGLMVHASTSGLVDVLRNLILNAVQHGNNSAIVVDARRLDYEFIEFSVSDQGPGIPPIRRFDLFDVGRTSGGTGRSGLGLDSARSLLREMGGDLTLDRTRQRGARFVGRLQVAHESASHESVRHDSVVLV